MPGHVAPQQALHGCQLPEYRGSQQDQLQHQVRPQNPDDHLPRHRPPRLHGLPLDHRQLDTEAVRKVRLQDRSRALSEASELSRDREVERKSNKRIFLCYVRSSSYISYAGNSEILNLKILDKYSNVEILCS